MPEHFFADWRNSFVSSGVSLAPIDTARLNSDLRDAETYYVLREQGNSAIVHHCEGKTLRGEEKANLYIQTREGRCRRDMVASLCQFLLALGGIQLIPDDDYSLCKRLLLVRGSSVADIISRLDVPEIGIKFYYTNPSPLVAITAYGVSRRLGRQLWLSCRNFDTQACLLGFGYLTEDQAASQEANLILGNLGNSRSHELKPQLEVTAMHFEE